MSVQSKATSGRATVPAPAPVPAPVPEIAEGYTIVFTRTDSVKLKGQRQFQVGGSIAEAMAACGIDQGTISSNQGRIAKLNFRLSDGTETPLYMGDTHSIWENHQKADGSKAFWQRVFEATAGDGAEATLTSIDKIGSGFNKVSGSKTVMEVVKF